MNLWPKWLRKLSHLLPFWMLYCPGQTTGWESGLSHPHPSLLAQAHHPNWAGAGRQSSCLPPYVPSPDFASWTTHASWDALVEHPSPRSGGRRLPASRGGQELAVHSCKSDMAMMLFCMHSLQTLIIILMEGGKLRQLTEQDVCSC